MNTKTCPTCQGNDQDAPCAYPSEGKPGCLRDARLLATISAANMVGYKIPDQYSDGLSAIAGLTSPYAKSILAATEAVGRAWRRDELLRELSNTVVDFGPRGTQVEILKDVKAALAPKSAKLGGLEGAAGVAFSQANAALSVGAVATPEAYDIIHLDEGYFQTIRANDAFKLEHYRKSPGVWLVRPLYGTPTHTIANVRALAERWNAAAIKDGFAGSDAGFELLDVLDGRGDDALPIWRDTVRGLLDQIDRKTCTHENRKRGGAIWTICEDCGKKWADDEGGFKPHVDSETVAAARRILNGETK